MAVQVDITGNHLQKVGYILSAVDGFHIIQDLKKVFMGINLQKRKGSGAGV